jgi:CTP:molybdopterin cytidylyltransferase MocA
MEKSGSKIAAIIPAAGFSSRIGGFKPLMPVGSYTAVERVIMCFQRAGISDIKVVVGFQAGRVAEAIERLGAEAVYNSRYNEGMFTSIQAGVRAAASDTRGFFILPADIPLVSHTTVKEILKLWESNQYGIIYPTFNGERGHPPLISLAYREEILGGGGRGGLRETLALHEESAYDLATEDQGVLLDMDAREDYHYILERMGEKKIPDLNDCWRLLSEAGVDGELEKHCCAVAYTAFDVVRKLNRAGTELDEELVLAGAILHDVLRHKPEHAKAGERYLNEKGYPLVAEIVGAHMDIEVDDSPRLTEAEIVYYADKLVSGNSLSSINNRFEYAMRKYGDNPQICGLVLERLKKAQRIEGKIKKILGFSGENNIEPIYYCAC